MSSEGGNAERGGAEVLKPRPVLVARTLSQHCLVLHLTRNPTQSTPIPIKIRPAELLGTGQMEELGLKRGGLPVWSVR